MGLSNFSYCQTVLAWWRGWVKIKYFFLLIKTCLLWICSHLAHCDFLTGFWISHKYNLAHISLLNRCFYGGRTKASILYSGILFMSCSCYPLQWKKHSSFKTRDILYQLGFTFYKRVLLKLILVMGSWFKLSHIPLYN